MSLFEQFALDIGPVFGVGEAKSITRIVLEDAFGAKNLTNFRLGSADDEARFLEIRQRLLNGEPVQYVLGEADFWGLKFRVSPDVLIPRQETEEVVAYALDWLKDHFRSRHEAPRVLDIGIGSGCIGISIAHKRPDVQLTGTDKSEAALSIALYNAEHILGAQRVDFRILDVFDAEAMAELGLFDLIVSNPPYIPHSEEHWMPDYVLKHEPHLALFVSDEQPLIFYEAIAALGRNQLREGALLLFECNEFNAQEVIELLLEQGYYDVACLPDLSGADRIVVATR